MSEARAAAVVRALRRATGYVRLYGPRHALTEEAVRETAAALDGLIGDRAGIMLGAADDTLFLDGHALGLISLQFNAFVREVLAAGIETVIATPPVSHADAAALVHLIAGEGGGPTGGSIVVNGAKGVAVAADDTTPVARLRRAYTRSLDALRGFGRSVVDGDPPTLEDTAAVVKDLLDKSLENPAATLLLSTVKSHHEYTFYHSVNTSILSLSLARLTGLPERDQVVLGIGAMLHDIGKIGVSRAVLQHPGRLDADQWAEIRRHPQLGAEAILRAAAPGEELAAVVAFEHHARFDGSGYPRLVYHDGTRHPHGEGGHHHGHGHGTGGRHPLHFYSRLVAVADTYDAITTRRSYRRAESPSRALQVLLAEAGRSYDPDFVTAFASMMGIYPPGTFLRLTSGAVVMVVSPSPDPGAMPAAVVVRDAAGNPVAAPEPVAFSARDIVDQVGPAALGLQPADVLESLPAGV
ncbi:MAG: HD domain-containing protein [Actinobacteria bacterium]|nr:HD domain-containing protein [Actinomycetota bacterium]